MAKTFRAVVAPLYLFTCLIVGATGQGVIQDTVLQISGLAILGWAAAAPSEGALPAKASQLLVIAILAVGLVALQNVPLPTSFWAGDIRGRIADDIRLFGKPPSFATVSLAPYQSLASLLAMIPPLAMFCALVRLQAYRLSWLMTALVAGTVSVTILSVTQIGADSAHLPDLLLVTLAFILAAAAGGQGGGVEGDFVRVLALIAIIILLMIGLAVAHSAAGYALAPPVLLGSVFTLERLPGVWRRIVLGVGALTLIGAFAALSLSPIPGWFNGERPDNSSQSRSEILATTSRAVREFMPLGSGLGSFASVYPKFGRRDALTVRPVPHAYDDYAEVALELGLPGVILVLVFLKWWIATVKQAWELGTDGSFSRAAGIASAAMLIHSLFDFPLRTSAISVCFAMCLGLLVNPFRSSKVLVRDLRSTRHIVIG